MLRTILPALALACVCSPALAAEASDAVTWGGLGAVFGWLALAALVIVAVFGALAFLASGWDH